MLAGFVHESTIVHGANGSDSPQNVSFIAPAAWFVGLIVVSLLGTYLTLVWMHVRQAFLLTLCALGVELVPTVAIGSLFPQDNAWLAFAGLPPLAASLLLINHLVDRRLSRTRGT